MTYLNMVNPIIITTTKAGVGVSINESVDIGSTLGDGAFSPAGVHCQVPRYSTWGQVIISALGHAQPYVLSLSYAQDHASNGPVT